MARSLELLDRNNSQFVSVLNFKKVVFLKVYNKMSQSLDSVAGFVVYMVKNVFYVLIYIHRYVLCNI